MLWAVLGAMTGLAVGLVVWPFVSRRAETPTRGSYDLEIYRDQLAEIDREAAQGLLSADGVEAARAEIGRRALAVAGDLGRTDPINAARIGRARQAAVVAVAVPLAAAGIYLWTGSPGLPGAPARDRAAIAANDTAALVEQLARRMEQSPNDPVGWALLGRSFAAMRQFDRAAAAYGRAVALGASDADLLSRYGEALTFAGDGSVSPAARGAFDAALGVDAKEPRARYYLGLADLQAGKRREALAKWRALLEDSPADAPWTSVLKPRIDSLVASLGKDPPAPTVDGARPAETARGPTEDDVAAAGATPAADRMAMIRAMVEGLAARLEENPDDFAGWMRLGRSRAVLGEAAKSRDAYGRAVLLRPGDVQALSGYASALAEASGGDLAAEPRLPEVLDKLLRADPDSHIGLWLSGMRAAEAGESGLARLHWSRLRGLLPEDSPQRAELRRRLDRLDGAEAQ